MKRRNTIQKELILNAVRTLKTHVTADEVYEYLLKEYPNISRGTVYRNLNLLSEEGKIKKVNTSDGADIYDFSLHEHYHVRCDSCGKVFDVDMDVLPNLISAIKEKHGFEFYEYDIFFKGICPKCLKEKDKLNLSKGD